MGDLHGETELLLGQRLEAASVGLIDPEVLEARIACSDPSQEQLPALAVVDVRGVHPHRQDETERIDQEMTLPSVYSLGAVIAADPPFSVVRTD